MIPPILIGSVIDKLYIIKKKTTMLVTATYRRLQTWMEAVSWRRRGTDASQWCHLISNYRLQF